MLGRPVVQRNCFRKPILLVLTRGRKETPPSLKGGKRPSNSSPPTEVVVKMSNFGGPFLSRPPTNPRKKSENLSFLDGTPEKPDVEKLLTSSRGGIESIMRDFDAFCGADPLTKLPL